jgi:hypothetical protein
VQEAGLQIGDDGHLGGFEALRLIRFVFLGVVGLSRSDRMLVVAREGVLSTLSGAGSHAGMEPSAHAPGYHLTAIRAWVHGFAARLPWG